MYMTTLSVADARADFSKIVESAASTHERFEVTRNGKRVAVLLSADEYDALVETVEILSDPKAMQEIRGAESEAQDDQRRYSVDEVKEEVRRIGRAE